MKVDIKVVQEPDFPKMERAVSNSFNKSSVKLVAAGAKYLRSISPGKLDKSIRHNQTDIWSVAKEFKLVDEGTRPHRIEGLLVFHINGAKVFSWGVDHPGTKAQHLTEKTVKYLEDNIKTVRNDVNRVIT